jgi:hypothetical protein
LHLPASTARVEGLSASFGVLPAGKVAVANSPQRSWLLRQAFSVFTRFIQVQASLPLRPLLRSKPGALPINKANNFARKRRAPDAASRAGF